jgi:hypothetical protein
MPKIYDGSDCHGLTCHITYRDELAADMDKEVAGDVVTDMAADDVATTWQMTWQPHGR